MGVRMANDASSFDRDDDRSASGPPCSERATEVALAEYNALRAEIITRTTAQGALVALGVTAVGVILGLALKETPQTRLALAVPPVAAVITLLYCAEMYRAITVGHYIRQRLWPYLQAQVGPVPSWEIRVVEIRRSRWNLAIATALTGPATGFFTLASVFAIFVAGRSTRLELLAAWILTCVTVAAPILVGIATRAQSAPSNP